MPEGCGGDCKGLGRAKYRVCRWRCAGRRLLALSAGCGSVSCGTLGLGLKETVEDEGGEEQCDERAKGVNEGEKNGNGTAVV
jgi:hypothetical protein